ncbi:MAG: hypothetical protein LUE14_05665, partial [Clostridiales bacterium]|nr:hypothetical protein [Clostridiales bacterium]
IKDYIVSMRKIIVKISDEEAPDFKWKVKQRQEVKRRELVAVYTYKEKEKQAFAYKPRGIVQTEVRTTVSGTIFCFRDKCINYGVVSHHADNKDSVKSWALAKEQFI